MARAVDFVDVATPDRGSFIVVEAGELAGQTCRVLSIKRGERSHWLELRLADGRVFSVPAAGLAWHYEGAP